LDFSKHKDKFSASINSVGFGAIVDYKISYEEKKYSSEEEAADNPKMHYVIRIKRRLDASGLWQTVKFYDATKFKVSIVRDGIKTIFTDSELILLEETLGDDRLIYQTMEFSSFTRTEDE